MKISFTYLTPALVLTIALLGGCAENKSANPAPLPSGTFSGEFRLLHRTPGFTNIDTIKAAIQLVLQNGTTFKVLGDTTNLHAGSTGHYSLNGGNLTFQDNTHGGAKTQLNGTYSYFYDGGGALQMVFNSADTLTLQYDLKKVN
ncbi:hypothetical protein [Mucilaginibacter pedocola]|uniref:DUF306 domain-containing protein n=1 Tax=Mucilaginibacter pedocola TaxID=1792845 RepID=A0A1S9PE90_9SPHI|nr:hypothetical protein [Mucilaginibacter pedocola]OOQ59265.1 hypothetical protein BC343_28505 [Mucilaginibacter pedocola]